jgi:hypothetical protein
MNYKIKSNGAFFTIGNQRFDNSPVNLVEITCLTESFFGVLFDKSVNNKFVLLENDKIVNSTPIISRLIQYKIDGNPTDRPLLNSDLNI